LSKHCTTINGQVDAIACSLHEVCCLRVDQAAPIKSALEIVHQIKGTSGSMGYSDVSAAAARLELCLKGLETPGGPVSSVQLEAALVLLGALQQMARSATPEMSPLYNADLSRLTDSHEN
jgi:chemotaxis protein histidine kinase CheA